MPLPEDRLVYKILGHDEWREAVARGSYLGSADDLRDGFIHLSTAGQLAGTAARHFKGKAGLVLVAFDPAALGPALRWEASRGGALFPHLYQPLDAACALSVTPMPLGADGVPQVPGEIHS